MLPTLDAGAEILVGALRPELIGGFLSRLRCVIPIHADDVLGELLQGFRLRQDDVAKEHGLLTLRFHMPANLPNPLDVHPVTAGLICSVFPPAAPQVKGLISVDVKQMRGEKGQKFVNHPIYQRQGGLVRGVQRMVIEREGNPVCLFYLRQMPVALGAQDLVQVPQRGNGRHQVDLKAPAVGVQLQNVRRGQRRVVPPYFAEAVEQEGVLHVQMQLVDFIIAAPVCQFL